MRDKEFQNGDLKKRRGSRNLAIKDFFENTRVIENYRYANSQSVRKYAGRQKRNLGL